GKVIFDGAPTVLRRRFAPYRLLEITVPAEAADRIPRLGTDLPPGVALADTNELGASLTLDPTRIATADAIAAVAARIPLADLTVREPELESILRQIYESPGVMM
ncbi:MAG: hypothetical protein WBA46_15725, partial [Thermomicrobiales bacterium]